MPIPKPKQGEKKKDYISRCMADSVMLKEYPDQKKRAGICYSQVGANIAVNTDFTVPLRTETFENEPHLIVPTVLLVEGVHNQLLYTRDDMAKFTASWNGIPLPVSHPKDQDAYISANDPKLIESRSIGRLFNVSYVVEDSKAKNKGELWININKANKIAPQVLTAIYTGKLEVSTALFHDFENKTGNWNGEEFIAITRNYRPDHLALLPGEIGACSWADGCGAPRVNKESGKEGSLKDEQISANDMGIIEIKTKFRELLAAKSQGSFSFWIRDVFPNEKYFIYEREEKKADGDWEEKLFKRSYTQNGDAIDINDDATEVQEKRVFEEVTATNQQSTQKKEANVMPNKISEDRKQRVDALIANEKISAFDEGTREWLMGLDDCPFTKVEQVALQSANVEQKKPEDKKPEGKKPEAQQQDTQTTTANTQTKQVQDVQTADLATLTKLGLAGKQEPQQPQVNALDKYISQAPPELQEVLRESVTNLQESKNTLVGLITANQHNIFTKEQLMAMDIHTLEGIVRMSNQQTSTNTNFGLRAGGVVPQNPMATNESAKIPAMPKTFEIN